MSAGEQSPGQIPENSSQSDQSEDSFDPGLGQLRDQVKKIMIPLLIKIFELKLSAQQAKTPPSRLYKQVGEPPEKIRKKLEKLDDHLKQLQLWCHSCQNQIAKALSEIEDTAEKPVRQAYSEPISHPAVEKSFSDAISKSKQGWISKWFFPQQKSQ